MDADAYLKREWKRIKLKHKELVAIYLNIGGRITFTIFLHLIFSVCSNIATMDMNYYLLKNKIISTLKGRGAPSTQKEAIASEAQML